MNSAKALIGVDWTHYIKRENVLYLFLANIVCYHKKLREVTGYGIKHQFYLYHKPAGIFYMSAKELKESEHKLFATIKENKEKVLSWLKEGEKYNQLTQEYIKNENRIVNTQTYMEIAEFFENVLFYGTILPFRILSALERAHAEGQDITKFIDMKRASESLRSTSLYPHLLKEFFPKFWKSAADKAQAADWTIFSTLTREEMDLFLLKNKKSDLSELQQRAEWCVFWEEDEKIIFSYDRDLPLKLGIEPQLSAHAQELKGRTAYPGNTQGHVRIINKIEHSKKFKQGEILVSINTNPSLTPIIKKCGAIVTDEGGLACHASIIARELKIPCVVGTGHATHVLKDGDLVEVDATKGIVRIIKKE